MELWERLSRNNLYLDETDKILEVDPSQVERFYLPLADWIIAWLGERSRLLVGVAGPPGCGKSAFSALLAAVINAPAEKPFACVVGMDGWHYSNSYLETHFIERGGKRISLRSIKGAPETFDVQAMRRCLAIIRQGGEVRYPVYSRNMHDPIAEGGQVLASHRVVIVEGNYLFLDEAPWNSICSLFDLRISIKASLEALRTGLEERHLRGGKLPDFIEKHIREVDIPNAQKVLSSSVPGSIIVHKRNPWLIQSIDWPKDRPVTSG